jgi:nanoRNase/pAp phosphatase (c-di-AMP/oligoRNAs hydrolase)
LRNILRRTKATAIIGAIQGVTRPENLRMVNLLDIHVETITTESLEDYDRIAMVDVQPELLRRGYRSRRSHHRPPPRAAGI